MVANVWHRPMSASELPFRFRPIADISEVAQKLIMAMKSIVTLALVCSALSACGESLSPPLPPLLKGATSTGGANFLCAQGQGQGSTPDTVSHSPEMVQRLEREFPVGSQASELRNALSRQGFVIHDACSPDKSISWASFSQTGGNGITVMAAFGKVHWKEDEAGRIVWTTGDTAFRGL